LLDSVGKRLVSRDGHIGVTVGQGDGLGLAARVSGKGLAHAHILVIAEILGKIRARVAADGPAEMAAAASLNRSAFLRCGY
jgi:hypothetical protein